MAPKSQCRREADQAQILLKHPDPSSTYRDKVGPREVPDDSSRRADTHVADDGEQPSTEATREPSG